MLYRRILPQDCVKVWKTLRGVSRQEGKGTGGLPMPIVRLFLGKEMYRMFRWFNEAGFQADIAALRRSYPGVRLHTLEEWLRDEGWHKRARHVRAPKSNSA